jgi:ADP-heptose:LPS heptosyltransferase
LGAVSPPLLFITGNRLGDAILTTGVLAHVMALRPDSRVTVACGAIPAPLFEELPRLDRVLPIEKIDGDRIGHWVRLWRETSGTRWGEVIDVRSAMFAWTVRAQRRWVCRAEKRHEHRIEELGRMLRIDPAPAPVLWVSAERQAKIAKLHSDDRPLLAIGPTANWVGKRWPGERFAEVARRLTAPDGILPGARLVVMGAAHERAEAAPMLAAAPDAIDAVGTLPLLDSYALMKSCALYIGNDSGLMHMASAAGIPTLGLFGPSAEWRYRPWGPKGAFVRTPESLEEITGAADYDYLSDRCWILGLTTDAVVEAATALWNRTRPE